MKNMGYVDENYEYFTNADLKKYLGEYIAIHDNKVQFHHKELKQVYKFMKENFPDVVPFITQVCTGQAMIL
jgi:hypothetical protein